MIIWIIYFSSNNFLSASSIFCGTQFENCFYIKQSCKYTKQIFTKAVLAQLQ